MLYYVFKKLKYRLLRIRTGISGKLIQKLNNFGFTKAEIIKKRKYIYKYFILHFLHLFDIYNNKKLCSLANRGNFERIGYTLFECFQFLKAAVARDKICITILQTRRISYNILKV